MSDELVNQFRLYDEEELQELPKRLREMYDADDCCEWCEEPKDEPHHTACDLANAADEIERLRVLLDSAEIER